MATTINSIKTTTAVNAIVDIDDVRCVIDARSINPETGDLINGNVQVQKKTTVEGNDQYNYAGQYNKDEAGNVNAGTNGDSGMTLTAVTAVAEAALEAVKAEMTA